MANISQERQLIEAQMNVYKASRLLNSALSSLSIIKFYVLCCKIY